MIRGLVILFFGMGLVGALTAHLGAALLALLMAGICIYAERHFAEQDRKWAADPANAPLVNVPTQHALDMHECECMRAKH